jgi:ubiquinone biosynthesis protein
MMAKLFQIDPQELAAFVPDCYAEFRRVVADGLTFFLRELSPARLAEVLQAQAELPAGVNLPLRLALFLRACPALHKIGQILARNRHLDLELRRHLQGLETLEPHTPIERLRPILASELAPAVETYQIRLADQPLAEGSVAVVMPLTWSDPADGPHVPRRHGVAKVLMPRIVERLEEDLAILGKLAGYLEERSAAYGLPVLPYQEVFSEVAELLTHEVQLPREQTHLRLAANQFAGRQDVQIPSLLPFCTVAMTAMERVYGCKITDPLAMHPWQRPALFRSTVGALLSGVLLSRDESMLFHGDPHAGNLMATRDGRLAILDWSLAGQFTAEDRVRLAQMLIGAWALDGLRIANAVAGLACAGVNANLIQCNLDSALARIRWHKPAGPAWVISLLDDLASAGVRFPPRLLLFRKAFLTLQGVLSDLCPLGSLEATLMVDALVEFTWEWPMRWWKPLADNDYPTRVSSLDLVRLAFRLGNPSVYASSGRRVHSVHRGHDEGKHPGGRE